MRPGLGKPYAGLGPPLAGLGATLPGHLSSRNMHLDPDFDHLTYGDRGERAKQIRAKLGPGDLLVFYAGMRDLQPPEGLIYALIGLYVVEDIVPALTVPAERRHENAHTRRFLSMDASDIVVRARQEVSGRLERCIPIGNYRERAYRVWPTLLKEWGGLSVSNGYLQRSARLPELLQVDRFYRWFREQNVALLPRNN